MTRAFRQLIDPEAEAKRAAFLAQCRADMARLEEPAEERPRPVLAWLILCAAIVLVAFFAAGCAGTVERESYAPLTSPRPEARPW